MGLYYSAPLLGPALGPILGGSLTQGWSWRATFWFLAIFVGLCFLSFIPFKDTFRRERSLTYQTALKRKRALMYAKASGTPSEPQDIAASRVAPSQPGVPGAEAKSGARDDVEEIGRDRDVEKQQKSPHTEAVPAPMDDSRWLT